jgi:hypothetical protein
MRGGQKQKNGRGEFKWDGKGIGWEEWKDGEYKAEGQQMDLGIEAKYHELSHADQDVRRMNGRGEFKWLEKGLG